MIYIFINKYSLYHNYPFISDLFLSNGHKKFQDLPLMHLEWWLYQGKKLTSLILDLQFLAHQVNSIIICIQEIQKNSKKFTMRTVMLLSPRKLNNFWRPFGIGVIKHSNFQPRFQIFEIKENSRLSYFSRKNAKI